MNFTSKRSTTLVRLVALIMVTVFCFLAMISCNKGEAPGYEGCDAHVDSNCDGSCDSCEANVEISHSDANMNNKCDKCSRCFTHTDDDCNGSCDDCKATIAINHVDADSDNKCDKCSRCFAHTDIDCDCECDDCGATIDNAHADDNSDYKCDKCGKCLIHTDANCDSECDDCTATVEILHVDKNKDQKCDKCGKCFAHVDNNCDAGCDECGAYVPIFHLDSDENNKCDKCGMCSAHNDAGCDGVCDECKAAVEIKHVDGDEDGQCDKCGTCVSLIHPDNNCNGRCDECGEKVVIMHEDEDEDGQCDKCKKCLEPCIDVEPADGYCDRCGERMEIKTFTAKKASSRTQGQTLYPTTYIEWSGKTYHGAYITYTITLKNTGNVPFEIQVSDIVPTGTKYVSGCDAVDGNILSWTVALDVEEETTISYTVSVSLPETGVGSEIVDAGATANGLPVDSCGTLYVANTFNETDIKYMEKGIRVLSTASYTGFEFVKFAYLIAFTNATSINDTLTTTPSDIITRMASGDSAVAALVAPGLYGGTAITAPIAAIRGDMVEVTAADLISGDLIIVKNGNTAKLYIVDADHLYDITAKAVKTETASVLAGLAEAELYAVLRPSMTIRNFTPSDPEEVEEEMTAYQEALVRTAETYLLRGDNLQYEDTYFALYSQSGEYRWAHGQKSPEEYTYDEWGYVNCAVFTYDAYLTALGYTLPNSMYTTSNLNNNASKNGMEAFRFTNTTPGNYTDAKKLEVEQQFMNTIEIGDIIVVRRNNNGHAMLYVGNGKFIHSTGSVFKTTSSGTGDEVPEPTIRYQRVADYLFNPSSVGGNPFRTSDTYGSNYVTELILVRPLNVFKGSIPENTLGRIDTMRDIRADKLSSYPSSTTVNPGDNITFTFSLFNVGNVAKTVEIYDKAPANTTYVSGGDEVKGGIIHWTVTVGAGETVKVSYTVSVNDVPDGTVIDGNDATIGGVKYRCAAIKVKNTLTAAQQDAIKAAIEQLRVEGTTLKNLELVNEIYRRALGVSGIFTTTDPNAVMCGSSDSIFIESSKTVGSMNCNKLRPEGDETYYSKMLVDHLYGGMRIDSSEKKYDRTRLLQLHNLMVGDILIARTNSAAYVYIYAGDGNLISLANGVGNPADFPNLQERIFYYGRNFAVVRPSFVIEQ